MVLSDGETYSELEGCKIIDIPSDVIAHEPVDLDMIVKYSMWSRNSDFGTTDILALDDLKALRKTRTITTFGGSL